MRLIDRHNAVDASYQTPDIGYAVAAGVLTEAVGPKLWKVENRQITAVAYEQAHIRLYPEFLKAYFIQSTVAVEGKGTLPWTCKIYYLQNFENGSDIRAIPPHGRWRIAWIKVDGKKVLDYGEGCYSDDPDLCPKW